MKFFEVQRKTKRNTIILGIFFAVTVILISALNAILVCILLDPKYLIKSFVASCLMFIIIYIWKYLSFSSGADIALSLGGIPLIHPIQDDKEKQLFNIVEEMAIASSLPLPIIFVLKKDLSINAFATGLTPQQAIIGVTQGCLDHLTRDELQSIVGHEFSHILNEDLKLNVQTAGVVSGFMFMMEAGKMILQGHSNLKSKRRSADGTLSGLGIILLALGSLGFFMGRIIQSAMSREREFLADASSAQFTRNPESLATALKKIVALGSRIQSPLTYGLAHIFFSSTEKSWFDTHPPIRKRIESLGYDFDKIECGKINFVEIETKPAPEKSNNSTLKNKHHFNLQEQKTQLIMPLMQAEKMLNEIRSKKVYESIQNASHAKEILMAILISEQTESIQAQSLIHTPSQSLELIQDLLSQIKENSFLKIVILQLALGFIKTKDLEYKQETLKYIYDYFRIDNKWTMSEALVYIYAYTTLTHDKLNTSTKWNISDYQALETTLNKKELPDPKELFLEIEKAINLPFQQKTQIVNNLFNTLKTGNEHAELYMLCLILNVPAPLKAWTHK